MDVINTKFQKKVQDNISKCQEKRRGLEELVQLTGGAAGDLKMEVELVPKKVCDKAKEEGRCLKFRSSNQQARPYPPQSGAKTLLFFVNINQEPV